ncbi:hypothetical protein GCM10009347_14190 [Shewanella algicola]|nr:hypothetical protein GCM10009347_14190 [Shewanella algicola]
MIRDDDLPNAYSRHLHLCAKCFATITRLTIMDGNNTPPATRKISALRGVTHFWESRK